MNEIKRYSRKQFLSPRTWLTEKNSTEEESPVYDNEHIDREVAAAIHEYLGLSPDRVKCFIRAGHHVVKLNHIEFMNREKVTHLMGELSLKNLKKILIPEEKTDYAPLSYKLKRIFNRIINPGIGSSNAEHTFHDEAIKTLLKNGFTVSTADGELEQLFKEHSKPSNIFYYAGLGLLSGLAGASVVAKSKQDISRRKFLGDFFGGLTVAAVAIWMRSVTSPVTVPLQRFFIVEKANEAQILLEENGVLGNDKDNPLGTFTEILVQRRNEIMALNYWHTIATTTSEQGAQNRILAYMGVGHGKAIDDFLEGPKTLEQKVFSFAHNILSTGLSEVIDRSLKDDMSSQAKTNSISIGIRTVMGWSLLFEDPITLGKNIKNDTSPVDVPSTARTVFIDALMAQLNELSQKNDRSEREELRLKVLQTCVKSLIDNMKLFSSKTISSLMEAAGIKKDTATVETEDPLTVTGLSDKFVDGFTAGNGQMENGVVRLIDSTISERYSSVKPYEVDIGFVKFKGRYLPVSLTFSHSKTTDSVSTAKKISTIYGDIILADPQMYFKITNEEQLAFLREEAYLEARLVHDPNSRFENFFRTSLTIVSKHTNPSFGSADFYVLQADPPSIYDAKLISVHNISQT